MGCRKRICTCLLILLETLQFPSSSTEMPSGSFRNELYNPVSEVKIAEENTWLNFMLPIHLSSNWTHVTLYKRNAPQCTFLTINGTCSVSNNISVCTCGPNQGEYFFAKRVNRRDIDVWTWREFTVSNVTANGNITINISYPTIVTKLTVQEYTYRERNFYIVPVNSSAQVICTWIKGNPPTAVNLKDENGILVHGEPDAEILMYNISTTRCHSIVKILCASVHEDGNNSVKILTECLPELINDPKSIHVSAQEQSVVLEFQMLSSRNITQCLISFCKEENSSNAMIYKCTKTLENYSKHDFEKCQCSIAGSAPNLRVTIHINNVSKDDNGEWLVNVSNSIGSVYFNFSLPALNLEMGCSEVTCANWLLLLQTLHLTISSTELPSGSFSNEFSEVKSAEENTWLNFTLPIHLSSKWSRLKLYKDNSPQCEFRNINGTCSISNNISVCTCGPNQGEYFFVKRVNRSDIDIWTWRVFINGTLTVNGTILINISYPTIVTNLTVNGYSYKERDFFIVPVNKNAQVVCQWVNGNPPTVVHLKDEHGILQMGEPDAGILIHNISTSKCYSTFNIVCASVYADRNVSIKILTECLPELIDDLKSIRQSAQEQSVVLEFEMLSSRNIMRCVIIHYEKESSSNAMIYECNETPKMYSEHDFEKCWCNVAGSTPNLRVTIHIYNVSKDDYGQWQTNVSNSVGSVHFNFTLPVLNHVSTSTHFIIPVGVIVSVGVVSITVIISIVVVLARRKKKLQSDICENEYKMVVNNLYVGSSTLNRMLNPTFGEIVHNKQRKTISNNSDLPSVQQGQQCSIAHKNLMETRV